MRRSIWRRVRHLLWFLGGGMLIGTGYGSLLGVMFRGTGLVGALVGAIDGATIAAPIGATETFLLRTRWGRAVQRAPFLVTFGVKWLVYGALITAVNLWSPGVRVLDLIGRASPLSRSLALLSVVFHGDVMNTAARLEQATRDLRRRFLVSAEALERLPDTAGYALESLGPRTLRGRAAPVDVYAVSAAP